MSKDKQNNAKDRTTARSLLPLVALGGGLVATPAAALELGELTVHSKLGQPLRASIAYALAPNEMLSNTCVSISSGRTTSGLPAIGANTVRITERAIMISGKSPIREPMLAARVTIDCPYTPNLSREYMLLVDPADIADTRTLAPAANVPVARPEPAPIARPEPALVARPETAPSSRPAAAVAVRRAPVDNTPIGQSTRYQVQPGDSLSEIVARIENRSLKLWPAVNLVFEANPDAFIDNDPNRLKAGSWLTIPSLDGTAPIVNTAAPDAFSSPSETPAADIPAPVDTSAPADIWVPAEETVSAPDSAALDEMGRVAEEPISYDGTADLIPGTASADVPVVQVEETVVIPDTELEGPQTTSSSPNVPIAIVSTGTRSESTSLLTWLVGGGLGLILALLLFGRRARQRLSGESDFDAGSDMNDYFDSEPPGATGAVDSEAAMLVESTMHFDIDDDSPTDENVSLDADLVSGTGLEKGETAAVHSFGPDASTDLDVELPFEPTASFDSGSSNIAPIGGEIDIESILDSEVLPEPDDEGDMTLGGETVETIKMPVPDQDETAPHLEAIEPLDPHIETVVTLNEELGLSMLEQDYEEEFTATAVLSREIEEAAAQLTRDLESSDTESNTSKIPLATVTEIDATAEPQGKGTDETSEFEATYDPNDTNALTVSMPDGEQTNRMPVANDDDTIEMDIEGGKVDTKKR